MIINKLFELFNKLEEFKSKKILGDLSYIYYKMQTYLYLFIKKLQLLSEEINRLNEYDYLLDKKEYENFLDKIINEELREDFNYFIQFNKEFKAKWNGTKK